MLLVCYDNIAARDTQCCRLYLTCREELVQQLQKYCKQLCRLFMYRVRLVLCVMQEYLLHNAMAIFTFVGNNLAQHDDAYSFQLITRTIDTVIPALITVSILFWLKSCKSQSQDCCRLVS